MINGVSSALPMPNYHDIDSKPENSLSLRLEPWSALLLDLSRREIFYNYRTGNVRERLTL
jgi:hypothetical protein